ncbi:MAG: AMP-binding protein [Flavobacteriales bacterium]|nr:AMP-binding protein [Flavobacteriales bacterium]
MTGSIPLQHTSSRSALDPVCSLGSVPPGFDSLTGLFAVVRAGGAFVPIDPTYPTERLHYLLEDSRVPILLTDRRSHARFSGFQGRTVLLDDLVDLPRVMRRPRARCAGRIRCTRSTPPDPGLPKGVVVPHRGVVRLVRDQNYIRPDRTWSSITI